MELNREQIIKALESCIKAQCENCCNLGNWHEQWNCMTDIMKNALSLINELTIELDAMRGAANSYKMHFAKLIEENERLNEKIRIRDGIIDYRGSEVLRHDECIRTLHQEIEALKADTVRKMQERLIAEIENTPNANEFFITAWRTKIDQIAKDVLEEI